MVVVQKPRRSHALAYGVLAGGVALVASSFLFVHNADREYDAYLRETDPGRIERLYDRAVLNDRLASGALLTGEILIVTGVYLRFLKHPRETRLGLAIEPGRCALALRF